MNEFLLIFFIVVGSYLLGSINFAIIVTKIFIKDDIRNHGSHNPGMSNVLRVVGKKAAFFTVLGDTGKGLVPVLIAKYLFLNYTDIDPLLGGYIAGFSALIGHILPVFYGFKGGKGILTGAGIIIAIDVQVFIPLLIIFLILAFSTKIISIGSLAVAVLLPPTTYIVQSMQGRFTLMNLYSSILFMIILLYMHRENIKRLLNGTENKFKKKVG